MLKVPDSLAIILREMKAEARENGQWKGHQEHADALRRYGRRLRCLPVVDTLASVKLLTIEATLRRTAKRVETYRMAEDADSDELDSIFEELLEQADQVRMTAQPIIVN